MHSGLVLRWKSGCPLVWDVTCPDTFSTYYELHATPEAGAVAALAERKNMAKYETIARTHLSRPIAIENSGVFGPHASATLCGLASQIRKASSEQNSKASLLCRKSVCFLFIPVAGNANKLNRI